MKILMIEYEDSSLEKTIDDWGVQAEVLDKLGSAEMEEREAYVDAIIAGGKRPAAVARACLKVKIMKFALKTMKSVFKNDEICIKRGWRRGNEIRRSMPWACSAQSSEVLRNQRQRRRECIRSMSHQSH